MARLRRAFFERYTPSVAKELLGSVLVRVVDGQRLSGVIVETEAYRGARDPASHAYRGRTPRNAIMFGEGGHAYVYFSYGFHNMLNFTTEAIGTPGAVLIRAVQSVDGIEAMIRNRGLNDSKNLADGPGKLTKALRVDRSLNGEDLVSSVRLYVESGSRPARLGTSSRVGVTGGASRRWRFFVKGSQFVSRGRPATPKP